MGDLKSMHRKSDSLRKFSGQAEHFSGWTIHMLDHMGKVHPYWKTLLRWITQPGNNQSLDFDSLRGLTLGPHQESAIDLAVKFEQVIADWLPETLFKKRIQLAGGKHQEGNGFTVWRELHQRFTGEGEILEYAGTQVLREYGRCKKLSDVSTHLDGWYELFEEYGSELENAHNMTRGMFLDIIPTELRTEILKEPKLNHSGHRALAEWCRNRVKVLTCEQLAEVRKKELTGSRKVHAVRRKADEVLTAADVTLPDDAPDWARQLAALQISAVGQAARPAKTQQRRNSPRRSPSPGRVSLVPDWGNKCFHCGSDQHTRDKCEKFEKMMALANPGVTDKKKMKPPEGYKSAIGKARDAARAASPKAKAKPKAKPKSAAKKKINAIMSEDEDDPAEDTASDSDFSEHDSGHVQPLMRFRPVVSGAPRTTVDVQPSHICGVNRFQGLDTSQSYDAEMLASLNSWAHNVRVKATKSPKSRSAEDCALDKMSKFVSSSQKAKSQPIVVVQNDREVDKASNLIQALPNDRKSLTKVVNRVSKHVQLAPDERLVMVDSGSFTHAIDADVDLPGHTVTPIGPNERAGDGESACGHVMKRTGRVKTNGTVAGKSLVVKWNVMKVKVPILSVRKLVRDKHTVRFQDDGGYIRNTLNGDKIPFFEHQGVYYLIMKIPPPEISKLIEHTTVESKPVFIRPEP
jgi:septum formation topological specificity factor MinE